jgi:hypothetical protein
MNYRFWMFRAFSIFAGAALLAMSLSFASARSGSPPDSAGGNDHQLMHGYTQVLIGMPILRLAALGLDTAKAERLSRLTLSQRFMPRDHQTFEALDPAVKDCYRRSDDCTAYIYGDFSETVVLLVQNDRVTWKTIFHSVVARTELLPANGYNLTQGKSLVTQERLFGEFLRPATIARS